MEIESTRKSSSVGNPNDKSKDDSALKRLNMWLKTNPTSLKTDKVSEAGLEFIESEDTENFRLIHINYKEAF